MTDPVFLGDDLILCDLSSPLFLHLIDDHQPAKPKRERARTAASLAKAAKKEGVEIIAPDGTIFRPAPEIAPTDDDATVIKTADELRRLI
jgi:hypothetical protein